MGSYNGNAIRLKVKKDTPPELLSFLDIVFRLNDNDEDEKGNVILPDGFKHIKEFVEQLREVLTSGPYDGYMPTYCWRVKEEKEDHWLYESRSHSKHHGRDEVKAFLDGLVSALLIEDGDILYRTVYEETAVETILYYTEDGFRTRDGYRYETDRDYITDEDHPYRARHAPSILAKLKSGELTRFHRLPEDDHLPWTKAELVKYFDDEEAKRKKRIEEDRKYGSGWGYC